MSAGFSRDQRIPSAGALVANLEVSGDERPQELTGSEQLAERSHHAAEYEDGVGSLRVACAALGPGTASYYGLREPRSASRARRAAGPGGTGSGPGHPLRRAPSECYARPGTRSRSPRRSRARTPCGRRIRSPASRTGMRPSCGQGHADLGRAVARSLPDDLPVVVDCYAPGIIEAIALNEDPGMFPGLPSAHARSAAGAATCFWSPTGPSGSTRSACFRPPGA